MNRSIEGFVAGLGATLPMTIAMRIGYELLPPQERYPLAPREITERLTDTLGMRPASEHNEYATTIVAHYLYGAILGSLFTNSVSHRYHTMLGGLGYGLIVWGGNYLGVLPATGLHQIAIKTPLRRNVLMIGAHIVWGASFGVLLQVIETGKKFDSRANQKVTPPSRA